MEQKYKVLLVGFSFIILIGLGIIYTGIKKEPATKNTRVISNSKDTALRSFVTEFGSKFKNVSLLASDVNSQLDKEYAPYVTTELLMKWKNKVEAAPGRKTSSPWPESVDVVSVIDRGDGRYEVNANVIEVTNDNQKMPVAVYPIDLTIREVGASFKITGLIKGMYSELPQRKTVVGTWGCLPHKDTSGPQTLECAIGLTLENGDHLAVDTHLMSTTLIDFPSGTKVQAEGVVTPSNTLSTDRWQKYDMIGIISITSIRETD